MSRNISLNTRFDENTESASLPEDDVARLILGMDGEIIFANAASQSLADDQTLEGQSFLKIAAFTDAEDAFRHSPLLFAQENMIFAALRSGLHEIKFTKSAQKIHLQFDNVMIANGTRYIVASALEHDERFSRTIESLIAKPDENSANMTRHFLDLSDDLLIVSRGDGSFESINEKFTNILGFHLNDLEGRNFLDLVHPDDRTSVRTSMQDLLHSSVNRLCEFECRLISNEASTIWTNWKHKKAGEHIYSLGHDVTAAKKHERALQRREQQLIEAEAIGHMGHWHWNLGQQDLRFSDEIYNIFGVSPEDFSPTLDTVNAMLHRRDAGRMEQAFQRAVIEQNDHEIDFRVVAPNGQIRHVRCLGRCEFDADGDVIGLYGIMQDVTQAMIHEQDLRQAKEAAERAYAAKTQFLANMSHELRTPLNAIIGFSEMMQQQLLGPIGNERYLDYIKGIHESGEHLLDLITDILDMSKIEAGKYELNFEEINVCKIIRLAIHMVEARASEAGIKITTNFRDENLRIVADRRAVMQIMLNLLSNAVKFSHKNGVVEVECAAHKNHVLLRVKDDGIGIPANKLPTITNPFEQAENQYTRSHEGSGLGLSITKELAEMHKGGIHIESSVGVGTIVTIRLPMNGSKTE